MSLTIIAKLSVWSLLLADLPKPRASQAKKAVVTRQRGGSYGRRARAPCETLRLLFVFLLAAQPANSDKISQYCHDFESSNIQHLFGLRKHFP